MKKIIIANNFILFLIILIFIQLPIIVFAKDKPFNENINKLPKKFSGMDIEYIYNKLSNDDNDVTPKSEFETNIEYKKRLNEEKKHFYSNNFNLNDKFVFTPKYSGDIDLIYNAETHEALIILKLNNVFSGSTVDSNSKSLNIVSKFNNSTYQAINGYGAVIDVEKSSGNIYSIDFKNHNKFLPENELSLNFQIKLLPSRAKFLKENKDIRFLVVGKLISPYQGSGEINQKPTFNDPEEKIYIFNYLTMNVNEIWIYEFSTGNILYKLKSDK